MENLVELEDGYCVRAPGSVRLDQLFRVERFAHKDVDGFTSAGGAVANDLCVIDVELGLTVSPVAIVLEQGRGELRVRLSGQEQCEENGPAVHPANVFIRKRCVEITGTACARVNDVGASCRMANCDHDHEEKDEMPGSGVANPAVIDLFALDQKTDQVVLAMHEPRPWDGSDVRLHELQEKFNAYVSFLLDGEMVNAHPTLVGKSARIELRCDYMPDDRAVELLGLIHDQIALQEIKMEVIVADRGCGNGCSCH